MRTTFKGPNWKLRTFLKDTDFKGISNTATFHQFLPVSFVTFGIFLFPGALSPEDRWGQVNLSIQGTHKARAFTDMSADVLCEILLYGSLRKESQMWFLISLYDFQDIFIILLYSGPGRFFLWSVMLELLEWRRQHSAPCPGASGCGGAEARSCCCHSLEQRAAVVPGQTACVCSSPLAKEPWRPLG